MAEKTLTIKKMYAEQIYHKGKKYEIRPVQNKYVSLKIPMLVGLQASTTSDPPSFNHGV
jgi:hypothetical protein